jgi:hypothetical protein
MTTQRINITELKERLALDRSYSEAERDFLMEAITDASSPATAYLDPGNYLGRIEQIWAFLSVDDGGEGVCAAPMGNLGAVPLIAADKTRLDAIRPLAQHIAKAFGKPVRLAKFTTREDVDIIRP